MSNIGLASFRCETEAPPYFLFKNVIEGSWDNAMYFAQIILWRLSHYLVGLQKEEQVFFFTQQVFQETKVLVPLIILPDCS